MRAAAIFLLTCLALEAAAQSTSQTVVTLTGTNTGDVSTDAGNDATTITYSTYGSTVTITRTGSDYSRPSNLESAVSSANASSTSSGNSTSATQTLLVGGTATASTTNGTHHNATSTSSSARPTNTVPCNGWPQFCERSYSNVTMVGAHNSPFVRPGNAASNQMLDVTTQLNDGIRMLQLQVHDQNGTLYMCHTSCDLLNMGPLEDYLRTVREWMDQNPYDVVTILMGNYDVVDPNNFTAPVRSSGIIKYAYTAPTVPMSLDDWPTLGEMILTQQRAVLMVDYGGNQQEVPWLLEEWSQMWETPFSPTNRDFPCTQQRPDGQTKEVSRQRMYMANHNLNVEVAIGGISLDIPAYNILNETNADKGYGSAGAMAGNCTEDWNRPPNFILVDYYNLGNFNGSVFQVAATANNVTYDRSSCCGSNQRSFNAAPSVRQDTTLLILSTLILCAFFV